MHRTRNDLAERIRSDMVGLLNARLADALDLQAQAKQAHWNVKGPTFIALHELFDKVADLAREAADELAERAVAIGGTADGTLASVVKRTTLAPYPTEITAGPEHTSRLADALATHARGVRAAIATAADAGDADTSDLFTELSRDADKMLWMIEAHLQS